MMRCCENYYSGATDSIDCHSLLYYDYDKSSESMIPNCFNGLSEIKLMVFGFEREKCCVEIL